MSDHLDSRAGLQYRAVVGLRTRAHHLADRSTEVTCAVPRSVSPVNTGSRIPRMRLTNQITAMTTARTATAEHAMTIASADMAPRILHWRWSFHSTRNRDDGADGFTIQVSSLPTTNFGTSASGTGCRFLAATRTSVGIQSSTCSV